MNKQGDCAIVIMELINSLLYNYYKWWKQFTLTLISVIKHVFLRFLYMIHYQATFLNMYWCARTLAISDICPSLKLNINVKKKEEVDSMSHVFNTDHIWWTKSLYGSISGQCYKKSNSTTNEVININFHNTGLVTCHTE